ncbi:arginine ABC transporter permease [Alkalihalophilus pseudofirmus]|uniref:amino acid ABC transporter permease n=1 Tax=Alkalihalobacterium alkalinitrilicum TaxID=427920 RepID=UPI00094C143F|nr:amino acid ABC transporter permease [Alkalihalobacterium alkalinitrilicum]OLO42808.1 arginine ABC transporter permease [Alkalihalophilus pseudofirmus]
MNLDFNQIVPSIPFIMGGIWVTLKFVSVSLIIGLVLGTFLAILKIGKVKLLVILSDIYTSIFRGTPLILQLSIIYFATPQLIDYNISAYEAGVLTFGLNSAAYISEIIRAGIQAVDKGQKEAAEALGIPYNQMMLKIILPQAFRNILPALFNEFITLTKESAIVSVIGVMDILRRSQVVASNTFAYFEPLLIAGVIYYVLVMALTLLGKLLERRLKRSD